MKKIYFLLPNLSAGGAERVTITIARFLKKNGVDVEFINIGSSSGEMYHWIVPEFKLISLKYKRIILAIPSIMSIMRKHPDAIFFSSREHTNFINLLGANIVNAKTIVRIPNLPYNVLWKGFSRLKMNFIKNLNKILINKTKGIIAQTEEMKDQIIQYYNITPSAVKVISNPVDKDYIIQQANLPDLLSSPFNSSETNFLNICNIAPSKGIDTLIEAWPIVKQSIPNSHMYIIGRNDSPYAKSLMEKTKNLKDFTFLGFQSNPYGYMKYCDVFVLPSRMEGFPNVVLEAMCLNKRIASTNCVKVIEKLIRPGKNGYFCTPDDANELAECMIKTSHIEIETGQSDYGLFDEQKLIEIFI